jgi:hypothetical protein
MNTIISYQGLNIKNHIPKSLWEPLKEVMWELKTCYGKFDFDDWQHQMLALNILLVRELVKGQEQA